MAKSIMNHDEHAQRLIQQNNRQLFKRNAVLYLLYSTVIVIVSLLIYASMPPQANRIQIFIVAAVLILCVPLIARLTLQDRTAPQARMHSAAPGSQEWLATRYQGESDWVQTLVEEDEALYGASDDLAEKPKGKPKGKPKREG